MRCFKQILCVFMVFTFNVLSLFNVIATVQHQPASKSLAQTKFQQDKPAIVEYIRNYNEYFGEQAEKYLILHDNSDRAYYGEHNDFSIYYVQTENQPQMPYSEKIGDYTFTVPEMETWGYTLGVYMVNGETVYTLTEAYENGTITNMNEVAVMIANSGMIEVTNNAISQVYPSTSISQTYPTTIEQISTSTTPKSTIPGGAYVTYNLTNVISSNVQGEVWGYYETTLSPEPGYKINYISIKQGVKDMDVINNGDGTYTFKNVGGFIDNLTISATAEFDSTSSKPTSTIPGGTGITYNLTNVISSNMQEEAWNGYETTLSPVPGYKINYISIKYGEEDMNVIDNGDGTYTFKHKGGFSYPLSVTASAQPITAEDTSQVSTSTTEPESNPTASEQITTSTTPKSTIPGGAYVTYNLTNVTSSNMQEEVWGYYETTLSPEPGYKINYISIKQGVEDMDVINNGDGTYTFRNNGGFINNLTITATAIPSSPKLTLNMIYTNAGSSRVVKVIDGTVKSWSTSNKNVATVNNGKVTAVGKGTATITATLTTGKKLTCKVTVTTSPRLTSTNISLKSGTSKTIKAVGGTVKTWTTSNKNVATVKDGKITALSKGTATVTATLTTGKKFTCKVTVTTAPRLSKTTVKVKKGGTATVKVSGKVATINNKYRNTKVAKITSKTNATTLKIKGLKKGTTSIKIKVNGVKTLNLKVKVK